MGAFSRCMVDQHAMDNQGKIVPGRPIITFRSVAPHAIYVQLGRTVAWSYVRMDSTHPYR